MLPRLIELKASYIIPRLALGLLVEFPTLGILTTTLAAITIVCVFPEKNILAQGVPDDGY